MKRRLILICLTLIFNSFTGVAQSFTRSELPTPLDVPWEILFGQDNFLWITEAGGKISRVHPSTGVKQLVYGAPDYFAGASSENHPYCFFPSKGAGTLGMALHPDFMNQDSAFIYFMYSYNAGNISTPLTNFKIRRLKWNHTSQSVIEEVDIVLNLPSGYDHLGGRLMIVPQNGHYYLFVTIGDNGISETNSPDCYPDQSMNPNAQAQNPSTKNGKIHRFNLDGSIPTNNPISGNSFYTRGHRNPQGLMYNSNLNKIYSIEHGDRTDDEINVLHSGMNYGWKNVRGYHADNNVPGESNYLLNYQPNPIIAHDSLVEPFYSWCAQPINTSSNNGDWCTVAPSDGAYYGYTAIPQWYNSLLVVTLKNGVDTDMEVYQFKLQHNGELAPSTPENPNPKKFFGEDQLLNGRLRDICISPDGKKIFLINNGGAPSSKITVYTFNENSVEPFDLANENCLWLYPNPSNDLVSIMGLASGAEIIEIVLTDANGNIVPLTLLSQSVLDISLLSPGVYVISVKHSNGTCNLKFVKR